MVGVTYSPAAFWIATGVRPKDFAVARSVITQSGPSLFGNDSALTGLARMARPE